MSNRNFREIVRAFSGQRNRRGVAPTSGDENKPKSPTQTNNVFKISSAYGKKHATKEHLMLDLNELKTMLPTSESESDKSGGKNHKINGEVCLLTESPFRILRRQLPEKAKALELKTTPRGIRGQTFRRSMGKNMRKLASRKRNS